jgi:hypothetical protein
MPYEEMTLLTFTVSTNKKQAGHAKANQGDGRGFRDRSR